MTDAASVVRQARKRQARGQRSSSRTLGGQGAVAGDQRKVESRRRSLRTTKFWSGCARSRGMDEAKEREKRG
jgi:hypothetical protein